MIAHSLRSPRPLVKALGLALAAACLAPQGLSSFGVGPALAAGVEEAPTVLHLSLRDRVGSRAASVRVDMRRARLLSLPMAGQVLGEDAKAELRTLAQSLAASGGRYVLIGGNDSSSPEARSGLAGFRLARQALAVLGETGVARERIIAASWLAGDEETGLTGRLSGQGRLLLVPVADQVRVIAPQLGGDPSRTLALDSASATLTLASTQPTRAEKVFQPAIAQAPVRQAPPAKAKAVPPAPPVVAESPVAADASPMRVAEPQVAAMPAPAVQAAPEAAAPPAPRVVPVPVVRPAAAPSPTVAKVALAPMLPDPRLDLLPPVPAPEQTHAAPTRELAQGCARPANAMDDFYPGGPFRDCNGRPRRGR